MITSTRLLLLILMAICGLAGWKTTSYGIRTFEFVQCDHWETYGGVTMNRWIVQCLRFGMKSPSFRFSYHPSTGLVETMIPFNVEDKPEVLAHPIEGQKTFTVSVPGRKWTEPISWFPPLIGIIAFFSSGLFLGLLKGRRSSLDFFEFRLARHFFGVERYSRVFLPIANNINEDLDRAERSGNLRTRLGIRIGGLAAVLVAVLDMALARLISGIVGTEKIR